MDTKTVTLAEFLLKRIAEDEELARECQGEIEVIPSDPWALGTTELEFTRSHNPTRVLADCEAKRRIVEEYTKERSVMDRGHLTAWTQGGQAARETALRFLALPYADHPDYDESWRP